ncbi:MAG: antibiotic biosynthesis monooxygenase [Gammaproteobacteria bacterium]
MILEVAILTIRPGQEADFEMAFLQAQTIISAARGYLSRDLQRCIESPSQYILLVNWETLEDHTQGFRGSPAYADWKSLLHHFYDPFPRVEHYSGVLPPRRTST